VPPGLVEDVAEPQGYQLEIRREAIVVGRRQGVEEVILMRAGRVRRDPVRLVLRGGEGAFAALRPGLSAAIEEV